MADKETIGFSVEIDGIEREIKSLKELKQATKDAKDEQLRAASTYGESSAEYKKATKNVADLTDKVDDLKDSTKTLQGSGVEKITSSFSQLGEGLRNLDTDKIKTGFRGIGAAMSAIPIFLLIEGLKYLVENFEEVSKAVKTFFNIASDAEKGIRRLEQAANDLKAANSLLVSSLENEAKILEAQGTSHDKILEVRKQIIAQKIKEAELDVQLQKAKIAEILSNDSLIESYYRIGAANARRFGQEKEAAEFDALLAKEKNARLKESTDLLRTDLITIQNLKTDAQVADIKRENEITAEHKKQNDAKLASDKKYLEDKQKAENEAWALTLQIRAANRDAQEQDDKRLAQVAKDEKAAQDAEWMAEATAQTEQETNNKQATLDASKQIREQELEDFKSNYAAQLQIAKATTDSLQSLSDLYFIVKNKNLQKGTAAELKAAEQQFKINKALAITSAIISGIQGVINALSAQSVIPEPFGTILKVASAVGIGIAAAANVAKIASTKFNPGGGAPSGGGATTSVPVPAPPSLSAPSQPQSSGTSFDENGKKIESDNEKKQPTIQVKASVGVDEVSQKQNRVESLEKQSTF